MVTSRSLCVARRRGRPRVDERHDRVSTWLPTSVHDALSRRALRRGQSVSSMLRDLVVKDLTTPQK